MIKVSILYPNKPGSHFDMSYYLATHMPLAMRLWATACTRRRSTPESKAPQPGEPPPFFGGCQFYFDSIEAFLEAWRPAGRGAHGRHPEVHGRDPDHPVQRGQAVLVGTRRPRPNSDEHSRVFPTLVYTAALQRSGTREFNRQLLKECRQLRSDDAAGPPLVRRELPGRLHLVRFGAQAAACLAHLQGARAQARSARRRAGARARLGCARPRAGDDRLLGQHHAARQRRTFCTCIPCRR